MSAYNAACQIAGSVTRWWPHSAEFALVHESQQIEQACSADSWQHLLAGAAKALGSGPASGFACSAMVAGSSLLGPTAPSPCSIENLAVHSLPQEVSILTDVTWCASISACEQVARALLVTLNSTDVKHQRVLYWPSQESCLRLTWNFETGWRWPANCPSREQQAGIEQAQLKAKEHLHLIPAERTDQPGLHCCSTSRVQGMPQMLASISEHLVQVLWVPGGWRGWWGSLRGCWGCSCFASFQPSCLWLLTSLRCSLRSLGALRVGGRSC